MAYAISGETSILSLQLGWQNQALNKSMMQSFKIFGSINEPQLIITRKTISNLAPCHRQINTMEWMCCHRILYYLFYNFAKLNSRMEKCLKKFNIELPYYAAIPFLCIYLREWKTYVLKGIIHHNPKEEITQYPSNECVEKMCYSHKMDYYSNTKNGCSADKCYNRNEPWKKSDIKDQYCTMPFIWNVLIANPKRHIANYSLPAIEERKDRACLFCGG